MSPRARVSLLASLVAMILCVGFSILVHRVHLQRVDRVTNLGSVAAAVPDAGSVSGYAFGMRRLVVPGDPTISPAWIMQTQEMVAEGSWRLRRVDYENAPEGRELEQSSPYRWVLATLAGVRTTLAGDSWGAAIEWAARLADPALHLLLLAGVGLLVVRSFGWVAAAAGIAIAALYWPFAARFIAAQPHHEGLASALALLSVLSWVARGRGRNATLAPVAAGVLGGLALWVSAVIALPGLIGLALGGAIVAWRRCEATAEAVRAWQLWGLAGAATVLGCFLIEFAPAHLVGWRAQTVHPWYGLGWLGFAHGLARLGGRGEDAGFRRRGRRIADVLALLVVAGLLGWAGWHAADWLLVPGRALTRFADAVTVAHGGAWLANFGLSLEGVGVMFGAAAVIAIAVWAWQSGQRRADLAVAATVAVVSAIVAIGRVELWGNVAIGWIPLAVIVLGTLESRRTLVIAAVAVALVPSVALGLQRLQRDRAEALTQDEVTALIHRDVAHWLASRTGGSRDVLLAPPRVTSAMIYFGNVRGVTTPDPANASGFAAAVRIAGATSQDEALALIERRKVKYLLLPSWDGFMDEFARLGAEEPEKSLVALLHQWLPPRWLQPVAYPLPAIPGFTDQELAIFQVVDVQENAVALSRLAEYFLESGRLPQAEQLGGALRQYFATDLSALIARAEIAAARQDGAAFGGVLRELLPALDDSASIARLPWDRRLALAMVLAQARQAARAQAILREALLAANPAEVRNLSPGALHRLLGLQQALEVGWPTPELERLVQSLVPADAPAKP